MNTNDNEVSVDVAVNEVPAAPVKAKRGFAAMSPEKRKEISSKGGFRAHELGVAHKYSSDEAKEAGKLGGTAPHKSRGRQQPPTP
jgi:general stress protein YciG